jgi:hypothetical protein
VHVADVIVALEGADAASEEGSAEARILHWDLPPHRDQPDDAIRAALDDLDVRVLTLLAELLSSPARPT